jgi:hypothetical protein
VISGSSSEPMEPVVVARRDYDDEFSMEPASLHELQQYCFTCHGFLKPARVLYRHTAEDNEGSLWVTA